MRTFARVHAHMPLPEQVLNRIPAEPRCRGEGFYSIGMQIPWHSEKVEKRGAEGECAGSPGVAERRITRTRHISVATFFRGARTPLWVGRFVAEPSPLGNSIPGRGAPGFWTSAPASEQLLNTCHVSGAV